MWKCEVDVLFLHSLDPKRLSSWTVKFVQIQAVAPMEINMSRILCANFAMKFHEALTSGLHRFNSGFVFCEFGDLPQFS